MACSVIAVSRSLGAGGEEVARAVGEALGFRYVDDEIIARAAKAAGIAPEDMGRVEQTEPLIVRILASMAVASPEPLLLTPDQMPLPDYSTREYRELIARVIRDTAKEGKVVIVAHGASIPLAGAEGLLRVFVTASPEVRAARVATEAGMPDRDAHRAIENSDNQRREFLRRFYGVREELPVHYDLVVNTDVLSLAEASRLVAEAAKA